MPMTSDELKEAFANLFPMIEPEVGHTWAYWRWCLRKDVEEKDPEEFLTWPTVKISMFVGNAPYIEYEVEELTYLDMIDEPNFGKPELLRKGELLSSGNLIHQAYHISHYCGFLPELETIVEIGGGYGAMALICHRLGFRGQYIIYDLPEFSLLQQYYLSNVGIDNVEFVTVVEMPRYTVCDLLIGIYSLGEMPLENRVDLLRTYPARSYLFAYQSSWGGYDNMAWASDMMRDSNYLWRNWNVSHLPNCWYLVGDKKNK